MGEMAVLQSLHLQRQPMRRRLDKGQKVGQHSSTNTLIEVETNTMALKHTGLWLTIDGWVDVADIDNDKVFDTKPSHSHPPHPTTKPTLSSLFTLKLKPFLLPIPQHSPPLSFCALCACHKHGFHLIGKSGCLN